MGQELNCTLHYQRRTLPGKAWLETDYVLFRGSERLKVLFKDLTGVKAADGLWVVYPKGVTAIREIDVIDAGRAAGLKDTKVASFSAGHTALRFVVPLTAR